MDIRAMLKRLKEVGECHFGSNGGLKEPVARRLIVAGSGTWFTEPVKERVVVPVRV